MSILNHELAAILPETRFGLAYYDYYKDTAAWETIDGFRGWDKPSEKVQSFTYDSWEYTHATGRAWSLNDNEYTVGGHWEVIPFSEASLEQWRLKHYNPEKRQPKAG